MADGMSCSVWPGNRYPIDVVKIPMAVPLTTAFKQNIERYGVNVFRKSWPCAAASTEDGNKAMKHTELRAAVLDALEKHDTGATLLMVAPLFLMEEDFPAVGALPHRR